MTKFILHILILTSLAAATSCSLPRIIVLNDPLTAEEHVRLGQVYESQGKLQLALQQYRAAVRGGSNSPLTWLMIGDLSFRTGAHKEAEKAYLKAISLDPGNGNSYNNLAWVYLEQGDQLRKAEQLAREAIRRTPEQRPYYLDTLGVVLYRQGRISEALEALEESVRTLPQDRPEYLSEAYGHLAEVYQATGDSPNYERSRAEAERYGKLK